MSELHTLTLPVFTQLAGVIFEKRMESVMQAARNSGIFVIETISQNTGDSRQYTEIDTEEYADIKEEGDQASRLRVQQGYTKTLTPYRVGKNVAITYEMRTRNKYQDIITRLTSLADLVTNRMDLDLSHRFTFGTATSYTDKNGYSRDISVGDTLALFSTAHTLKGSSTTFRNRLANNPQVSKGALEGMERLIAEETFNHLGEKVTVLFDVIWTGDDPNTMNTVQEYLKSTAAPDFANSGVVNVYKGKYRHIMLSRLATTASGGVDATKRRYFGIASTQFSTAHLSVWEESHLLAPPSSGSNGEDKMTDDWEFGSRGGYGIAIVNGNWIKFSSGDGTA